MISNPQIKKECKICCSSSVNIVDCKYCKEFACNKCQEKFLLENNIPSCMFCKREWTFHFISSAFSKSFINKRYKEHQEKILYDFEKSLLPETQRKLNLKNQANLEIENIKNQIINIINTMIRPLEDKMNRLKEDYRIVEELCSDIDDKSIYNRPCPISECRGYLSTKYKCGICEVKVCNQCLEVLTDNHGCNKNNIISIQILKQECRPCPTCNIQIYKISGCDMMWCTQCRTPFSWLTGKIEQTVNIHNPHYWEYLSNKGEDDKMIREIFTDNNDWNKLPSIYNKSYLWKLVRDINHIQEIDLVSFRAIDLQTFNEDLREKYLFKIIDESKFKKELQKRSKRNNFNTDIRQVLEMFVEIVKEKVTKFEYDNKHVIDNQTLYQEHFNELKNLIEYSQTNIKNVCNIYEFSLPRILLFSSTCFDYLFI